MMYEGRNAIVRTGWSPVHSVLWSFPIAGFSGAFVTDIVYAWTADMIWADFSDWLLAAGLMMGLIAALVGLIGLAAQWRLRATRTTGIYVAGGVIVLVLAGFNNLVHSRDAWTSVVPTGLALSAVTVLVMLLTAWLGGRQVAREAIMVNQVGAGI